MRVANISVYEAVVERHRRHFVTIEQNQRLSPDNDVTPGANSAHLPVTTAAVRPTTHSSKPFPSRHSDGRSPPDPQRSELDRACSGTIR